MKKWAPQVVEWTDGESVSLFATSRVADQRGEWLCIRFKAMTSLQPQGHLNFTHFGFEADPTTTICRASEGAEDIESTSITLEKTFERRNRRHRDRTTCRM